MENLSECSSSMAFWRGSDLLRIALRDYPSALIPSVRAKVNNPIGGFDYIKIMFDHYYRMTGIDKPLEYF